ncbi:MAG: hypothetical protein ACE5K9_11290, partial [Candidatus Methylomirabilales bacterium]
LARLLATSFLWVLAIFIHPGAAEPAKLILALGDDSYIPAEAVNVWTGAKIKRELGRHDLLEFSLVILSNIPYGALPHRVQELLPEYASQGGSLLITGGPNSYGSGGYQAVSSLIPFVIRTETDWVSGPFRPIIPVQPNHPILEGVTFRTVGTFNDLNPRTSGVVEIARYGGGGGRPIRSFGGRIGSKYPSPLIAERQLGQGTVLGVAFDLGREIHTGWPHGLQFTQNVITYLVNRSPLKPRSTEDL